MFLTNPQVTKVSSQIAYPMENDRQNHPQTAPYALCSIWQNGK